MAGTRMFWYAQLLFSSCDVQEYVGVFEMFCLQNETTFRPLNPVFVDSGLDQTGHHHQKQAPVKMMVCLRGRFSSDSRSKFKTQQLPMVNGRYSQVKHGQWRTQEHQSQRPSSLILNTRILLSALWSLNFFSKTFCISKSLEALSGEFFESVPETSTSPLWLFCSVLTEMSTELSTTEESVSDSSFKLTTRLILQMKLFRPGKASVFSSQLILCQQLYTHFGVARQRKRLSLQCLHPTPAASRLSPPVHTHKVCFIFISFNEKGEIWSPGWKLCVTLHSAPHAENTVQCTTSSPKVLWELRYLVHLAGTQGGIDV